MVEARVDDEPRGAHQLVAEVAEQVVALRAVGLGRVVAELARDLLRVERPALERANERANDRANNGRTNAKTAAPLRRRAVV